MSRVDPCDATAVRALVIEWLDDQYHFGEAEGLIGDDEDRSFLKNGILDSLGFVKLVLFLERSCGVPLRLDELTPANFDSLARIVAYIGNLGASSLRR